MFGCNLRVYCCVLKCQLLLPLLRQMNLVHTIPYCSFETHFNIIPSAPWSSKWSLFSRCLYHEGLSGLFGLLNLHRWRHHDPINIRKHSPETVSRSGGPGSSNVRWHKDVGSVPGSFVWNLWQTGCYWGRSSQLVICSVFDTHLSNRSGTTGHSTKGLSVMLIVPKEGKDATSPVCTVAGVSHCSWSATGITRGRGRHCERMAGTGRTSWL